MLSLDLTTNRQAKACLMLIRVPQPSSLGLPSDQRRADGGGTGHCPLPPSTGQARERGISRQLRFKSCVVRGHCWGMLAIRSRISHPSLRARLIPPTIEEGARY